MRLRSRPPFQVLTGTLSTGTLLSLVVDTLAYETCVIHLVVTAGTVTVQQLGSPDGINFGQLYDEAGVAQDTAVGSPAGFTNALTGTYAIQMNRPIPRFVRVQVTVLAAFTGTVSIEMVKRAVAG